MKTLTPAQINLLVNISKFMPVNNVMKYDNIKSLSECRNFDASFNALYLAGYFERVNTNNYLNQFIRIK
jgi:hypothetical protein